MKSHPLHKNIEVKTTNRPIKVAYLIPYEENLMTHWIIDAVFHESYTRWGGAHTLIIPTSSSSFLHEEYSKWLQFYDPDFICTYVSLEQPLIEKIDNCCCPIAFISYKRSKIDRWQDFLPDWGIYFKPVPSLSTIHSPYASYRHQSEIVRDSKITIITQYKEVSEERFVADNFGAALNLNTYPYPIQGLFDTICLVPNDLSERMNVGTIKTTSVADILSQISNKKAITIAKLSMAHSQSVSSCVQSNRWSSNFNLFIGETCLDRIHFWNARSFSPNYIDVPNALIVKKIQIEDEDFIKQLGLYLNKHNFLKQYGSQAEVQIRSFNHKIEELEPIQNNLKRCTYNSVFLTEEYNSPAVPSYQDFKYHFHIVPADLATFKLSETINKIQAKEPDHFAFTQPRFRGINEGQWIVELEIERHDNVESRFINVVNTWMPPLRYKAVKAFTENLGRISKNHRIALVPTTDSWPFRGSSIKKVYEYSLFLPDDETFFRWIALDTIKYLPDDLRSTLGEASYKNLALSDKGQNLRGVISMFDNLSEASECLTNKFWRQIVRFQKSNREKENDINNADEKIDLICELIKEEGEKSDIKDHLKDLFDIGFKNGKENKKIPDNIFSWDKLFSFMPNNHKFKEHLRKELGFDNIRNVNNYLKASFTDSLEFMMKKRVFYQVHQWRCSYCGHTNTFVFDHVKRINNCEICDTKYFSPIDLEWKYKLNDFVYKSLCERNELPVLWTLNYLKEMTMHNSFYYLPEVILLPNCDNAEEKNEIDILCMLDGKFYAVEVKLSATSFTNKQDEIEKFVKKIMLLKPDVALLAFEQYCDSEADLDSAKKDLEKIVENISERVGQHIKIKKVVASDFEEFNKFPTDLGYRGKRVSSMLDEN